MILQDFDFNNLYVIVSDVKNVKYALTGDLLKIRLTQRHLPIKTHLQPDDKDVPWLEVVANLEDKWHEVRVLTSNPEAFEKMTNFLEFGKRLKVLNLQFYAIQEK